MRYAPFWCEENVFHLCADRRERGEVEPDARVVFITNEARQCAVWNQRAAPEGRPILWDYHVIALVAADAGWTVWDLDTRLGAPLPFADYAAGTFAPPGAIPARFEPRFLVVPERDFLARFSSDRSHMRTRAGRYRKPPPAWPPIVREGQPHFLDWLDEDSQSSGEAPGEWMELAALLSAYGGGA